MKARIGFFIVVSCLNGLVSYGQTFEKFIEKVQTYQDSVKIKYNNKLEKDTIDKNTFNLKNYLALFDKIEFDHNLKFDYVYFDNRLDGSPCIYAVEKSFNLEDYIEKETFKNVKTDTLFRKQIESKLPFSFGKRKIPKEPEIIDISYDKEKYEWHSHRILYEFITDSVNWGRNHIKPLDTEDGYLQYLFFHELGEMFALKWHASYWHKRIICSKVEIKSIIEYYKNNKIFNVNTRSLRKLSKIEPTPIVSLNSDNCTIIWFEKTHFGVYKRTYKINRFSPYTIEMINEETTVEFDPTFIL